MSREVIKKNFLDEHFGLGYNNNKLPADASFRSYERVDADGKTYILMDAPPHQEEVLPFVKVGEFLYKNDFSAPEIIKQDVKNGLLLLEDFGNNYYSRVLSGQVENISESTLYRKAIDVLVKLHKTDNPCVCFELKCKNKFAVKLQVGDGKERRKSLFISQI